MPGFCFFVGLTIKLVINMHEIREIRHLHKGLYLCCATLVFEIYVDLYDHDIRCLRVGLKNPKYRNDRQQVRGIMI